MFHRGFLQFDNLRGGNSSCIFVDIETSNSEIMQRNTENQKIISVRNNILLRRGSLDIQIGLLLITAHREVVKWCLEMKKRQDCPACGDTLYLCDGSCGETILHYHCDGKHEGCRCKGLSKWYIGSGSKLQRPKPK